ncbi:hypothetical protein [Thiorhodovibrio winogradskyi]|uniref:hypothetical protein n=1 Tax=Thiorhodovibrio winogradskyi TaxID=77007 RepID=UPI002E2D0AD1|nr:hypothetical protein [Thiorhodovibrio winogradskyi]
MKHEVYLVVPREHIQQAEGRLLACEMLFGDQTQARHDEYFRVEREIATHSGHHGDNRILEFFH